MKCPNRATISRLTDLPNVGEATAADLHRLGIDHPRGLIGGDAFALYDRLCALTDRRHDPCVIDVFLAAIHFMDGGEALPWWSFTEERKRARERG